MNEMVPLKVDVLKVIENFMDMYPYPAPETLVVESIANGLDANARNIAINIVVDENGKKVFRVEDDGKGMTAKEFRDNYHALSVSSKIKGQGIGFAGVGSKLYLAFLASGESIVTETRSENFRGASRITVIEGEPRWGNIYRETLEHTGTIYEVKLRSEDAYFLTKERIAEIIRTHYNAILLGRYGGITITLDGEKVEPWKPELVSETVAPHIFKIRTKQFECYFWLAKEDLKQRQGIEIVVFGKKIGRNHWFDLDYIVKPHLRNKITGQILADRLATLLTTNKCAFRVQAGPALWTSFRKKAYDALSSWLSKVGAVVERPLTELDAGFKKLSKAIE
ncbi:ATP-binding protein, partial [Candidatus Bathyarchaeota archaeon]|nr:ATP-binding protein [Candidatus Bathyarchaeota archaeon]